MKGYKAFGHGMVCRGKQYAENTVFEEDTAEICKSGMHFCKNPLDCLDYYPLIDDEGNIVEIAEVESLGECKTDDNKKFCTKKLKIGGKINISKIVDAEIEIVNEQCNPSSGVESSIASSGEWSNLASSGEWSNLASSGEGSSLASSGEGSSLASSGEWSRLASSGRWSSLASSGGSSSLASSGVESSIASGGRRSRLASSGEWSNLASSGEWSSLASSGGSSSLASSGGSSRLASSGENSIVAGIGVDNRAKAGLGSWIVLAEWKKENGKYKPICVKSAIVDGETIKPDTWYKLENGEFVEARKEFYE